jgi:hypothetical protein
MRSFSRRSAALFESSGIVENSPTTPDFGQPKHSLESKKFASECRCTSDPSPSPLAPGSACAEMRGSRWSSLRQRCEVGKPEQTGRPRPKPRPCESKIWSASVQSAVTGCAVGERCVSLHLSSLRGYVLLSPHPLLKLYPPPLSPTRPLRCRAARPMNYCAGKLRIFRKTDRRAPDVCGRVVPSVCVPSICLYLIPLLTRFNALAAACGVSAALRLSPRPTLRRPRAVSCMIREARPGPGSPSLTRAISAQKAKESFRPRKIAIQYRAGNR